MDSHVHFYDLQHPELVYKPLATRRSASEPWGGSYRTLAERNYIAEDYIAETRNANVTKAVHVQAAIGSPDPVTETEWLQEAANRTGFPHGIVAYADLRDPGVEAVLERHCESPNMRGIRDFSYGDYLVEPDYHRGFALFEKFNLVSSMPATWRGHGEAAGPGPQVSKHPDRGRSHRYAGRAHGCVLRGLEAWRGRGGQLRQHPLEDLWPGHGRQQLDGRTASGGTCSRRLRRVGVDRSFFGSNWPVDWLWSTYDELIDAYTEIISGFSRDEQVRLFSGTAEEIYRI